MQTQQRDCIEAWNKLWSDFDNLYSLNGLFSSERCCLSDVFLGKDRQTILLKCNPLQFYPGDRTAWSAFFCSRHNKAEVSCCVGSRQFVKTNNKSENETKKKDVSNCSSWLVVYFGHKYCLLIAAARRGQACSLSDLLFQMSCIKFRLFLFHKNVQYKVWVHYNILISRQGTDWGQSVICCLGPWLTVISPEGLLLPAAPCVLHIFKQFACAS